MTISQSEPTEILPRLWVGSIADAENWLREPVPGAVLSVMPAPRAGEDHIPIIKEEGFAAHPVKRASVAQLNAVRNWICTHWPGEHVLVHCGAGVERSPLAVAWFLREMYCLTLPEAYTWLKARRAIVEDRACWLKRFL